MAESAATAVSVRPRMGAVIVALFKLRIVALLLVAALGGAFLAAGGRPAARDILVLLLAGAASAGGASALNEYIERDRDALMQRTRKRRPLATGAIEPRVALLSGLALVFGSVLLTLPFDPILSVFLFLGAFIYVVVYTLWLKPRTSLNIVIGGLAGSCAVLSGSAAAGAWADPGALLLALMLFFWTPIHFWSLALVYREDYEQVGVPMLPVTVSRRAAAGWALAHGVGVAASALLLALRPGLGLAYLLPAAAMSALLLGRAVALVADPTVERAWQAFHTSNLYLLVILVAVCAAATIGAGRAP
ncbi:MAG: heme o synthase [Anaerolineae bacterium]|nr:heme o synthase [Anaerolineae bacterium]